MYIEKVRSLLPRRKCVLFIGYTCPLLSLPLALSHFGSIKKETTFSAIVQKPGFLLILNPKTTFALFILICSSLLLYSIIQLPGLVLPLMIPLAVPYDIAAQLVSVGPCENRSEWMESMTLLRLTAYC